MTLNHVSHVLHRQEILRCAGLAQAVSARPSLAGPALCACYDALCNYVFFLLQVNVNPLWSQSLAVTGVLSLICIGLGWYYGFIGQWLKHQVWMVRTVLILFAFMLSRILILGGMSLGFTDFDRVAAWPMYLSWGPSFALHYLWTERRALRRHRVRQVNTT